MQRVLSGGDSQTCLKPFSRCSGHSLVSSTSQTLISQVTLVIDTLQIILFICISQESKSSPGSGRCWCLVSTPAATSSSCSTCSLPWCPTHIKSSLLTMTGTSMLHSYVTCCSWNNQRIRIMIFILLVSYVTFWQIFSFYLFSSPTEMNKRNMSCRQSKSDM